MLTREFSFVKLNWTSVIRFHLSCRTHSSVYSESIFFGRSGEQILDLCVDLTYSMNIQQCTFWSLFESPILTFEAHLG